ncbi:hypothetical protein CIHG_00379 [Coccidioides immitis H538.4]|uniref:Uncharacterized protein n=2 Tax=Coccidioides immitis TaxID=5501 RepID=A0A0J8RF65_COCIT|nr:hypothetical protein CIRG_07198 [Coccidioides immitis RMSCC 2394]KMU82599.1 hypothetical protein CIHG_00379 [Coccidioides immitis H538.4]
MEYREGNRHVPTPKPLRILKTRPREDQGLSSSVNLNSPIPIPRRRSSYAIPGSSFSDISPLPRLEKENRKSQPPRQKQRYWRSPLRTPSTSGNFSHLIHSSENKKQRDVLTSGNHRYPVLMSRNGFLSRVTQVFDFRSRHPGSNAISSDTISTLPQPLTYSKKSIIDAKRDNTSGDNPPLKEAEERQNRQYTPRLLTEQLRIPRARGNCKGRSPCNASITTALVELTADALRTHAGKELSTWLSVDIFARVDDLESNLDDQCYADIPLDVMIVVDNSARVAPDILKGASRTAFHVASSLDMLIDRAAIGCISPDGQENFNLMLPLGTHSLDVVRNVSRALSSFQLLYDLDQSRLSGALKEASDLLIQHSAKSALCHLFFITTRSKISIPGVWDERLRFHTISPENSVTINAPTMVGGWHLSASLDHDAVESALRSNLKLLIRHLRTGIDSGVLSNLSIKLSAAKEYELIALLGDTKRKFLRPGESWTMLAKVRERGKVENVDQASSLYSTSPDSLLIKDSMNTEELDDMINQLHGMLEPSARDTEARTIVTAIVEYGNPCLPNTTSLRSEGRCELGWIGVPILADGMSNARYRQVNATSCQGQTTGHGTHEASIVKARSDSWGLGVNLIEFDNHDLEDQQPTKPDATAPCFDPYI